MQFLADVRRCPDAGSSSSRQDKGLGRTSSGYLSFYRSYGFDAFGKRSTQCKTYMLIENVAVSSLILDMSYEIWKLCEILRFLSRSISTFEDEPEAQIQNGLAARISCCKCGSHHTWTNFFEAYTSSTFRVRDFSGFRALKKKEFRTEREIQEILWCSWGVWMREQGMPEDRGSRHGSRVPNVALATCDRARMNWCVVRTELRWDWCVHDSNWSIFTGKPSFFVFVSNLWYADKVSCLCHFDTELELGKQRIKLSIKKLQK